MSSDIQSPRVDALSIESLALQLQQKGDSGLRLNLPSEIFSGSLVKLPAGGRLVDGQIEFETLEARNAVVAEVAFGLLGALQLDINALFECAYKLWRREIGESDQASGRLLAIASSRIDILAAAARRIKEGADVFDTLHLVEAALPHLHHLETISIIELVAAKHAPTMNDMMSGSINRVLEKWLETRPAVASELYAKTLEKLCDENSSLLGNSIVAVSKSDYPAAIEMAVADARSGAGLRARVGAWTLGRLLLDDRGEEEEKKSVVEVLIALTGSEDAELRAAAIRAAVGAMHIAPVFDKTLEGLAESGDQDVLGSAASSIFFHSEELFGRGVGHRWLRLLSLLSPERKGAIDNFDAALSRLVEKPEFDELVIDIIGSWVEKYGKKVQSIFKIFDSTFYKITNNSELISLLTTKWLLSDDLNRVMALMDVLSHCDHHSGNDIYLKKEMMDDLSFKDLIFLCRRMLGYVHVREHLTSLAISMLHSKDSGNRIYPLLKEIFIEEIGYDYPGSTSDALRNASDNPSFERDKEFLKSLVDEIEKNNGKNLSLKSLKELRPPRKLGQLFALARSKQMASSFEEASKDSFWRQLTTPIHIKAGRGSFSYRNSSYGESTQLGSFSHSVELPRREVFDPVGNAIRHLGFRLAKRGD